MNFTREPGVESSAFMRVLGGVLRRRRVWRRKTPLESGTLNTWYHHFANY